MTHRKRSSTTSSAEVYRFAVDRAAALSATRPADRDPVSWYYEASHVGDLSVSALALLRD